MTYVSTNRGKDISDTKTTEFYYPDSDTVRMGPNLPYTMWGSLGLTLGGRVHLLSRVGDIVVLRRDFSAWDVYPRTLELPSGEMVKRAVAFYP